MASNAELAGGWAPLSPSRRRSQVVDRDRDRDRDWDRDRDRG